mgnify:CR=1 FL=1
MGASGRKVLFGFNLTSSRRSWLHRSPRAPPRPAPEPKATTLPGRRRLPACRCPNFSGQAPRCRAPPCLSLLVPAFRASKGGRRLPGEAPGRLVHFAAIHLITALHAAEATAVPGHVGASATANGCASLAARQPTTTHDNSRTITNLTAHVPSAIDSSCMNWFAKAVTLALAAVVMAAPVTASVDCDDAHKAADCTPACVRVCACHTVSALADHGPVTSLASPSTSRLCVAADTFVGNLLPADIFRPPVAA